MGDIDLRVGRVVDTEAFTLAFCWGTVFVAVGLPLAVLCVEHLAAGQLLVGCVTGAIALSVAAASLLNAATNGRRAILVATRPAGSSSS